MKLPKPICRTFQVQFTCLFILNQRHVDSVFWKSWSSLLFFCSEKRCFKKCQLIFDWTQSDTNAAFIKTSPLEFRRWAIFEVQVVLFGNTYRILVYVLAPSHYPFFKGLHVYHSSLIYITYTGQCSCPNGNFDMLISWSVHTCLISLPQYVVSSEAATVWFQLGPQSSLNLLTLL